MKTSGREFFYSVSGLMPPKYIVDDKLEESINRFVETVPAITENLEQFASYNLNIKLFVREMEQLYMILCAIHAHWLEIEAARILRLTEVDEGELCRTLLLTFITNVRTLAIDIQMAQNKGLNIIYRRRGEIERYNDVVRSMSIIISLMKNSDYKKAFEIAANINELQDSEYIMPLISQITSKNNKSACDLALEIKDKYNQKLEDTIERTMKTEDFKKILVADDMPEILSAVSHMLKGRYQVFPFSDGKSVLKAIDSKLQPDAFLLDIDMPKMDGFTLADKIRTKPKYTNTPLLFLTGSSTRNNLITSVQYNPSAFIVKPVNKDIIISKLSGCFKKNINASPDFKQTLQ